MNNNLVPTKGFAVAVPVITVPAALNMSYVPPSEIDVIYGNIVDHTRLQLLSIFKLQLILLTPTKPAHLFVFVFIHGGRQINGSVVTNCIVIVQVLFCVPSAWTNLLSVWLVVTGGGPATVVVQLCVTPSTVMGKDPLGTKSSSNDVLL